MLRGQRRNVLVCGGMERVQDARNVNDRRDIWAVIAETQLAACNWPACEIAGRARSESADNRHAVSVVEDQAVLLLHQAGGLLLDVLFEAVFVELNAQAARQQW